MEVTVPIDVALIGTGDRSRTVYRPLFAALEPWVRLVAVCDPVRESADAFAESMGVPAFYSLEQLVRARPSEAALIVTPVESHYAISCFLSRHGIHNLVETTMASLLAQAEEMVATARASDVVMRVAENFFRFPFDRLAKRVAETGFLGPVNRLTCFHDSLGFHNNSRWIAFYGSHPETVQAIEHVTPVAPHYEAPHRFHERETFGARFYTFPGNRLVVDASGNTKGLLGRYPRPGYTEIDGAQGTIVQQAIPGRPWHAEAEVRYCSDHALRNGGVADDIFPVVHAAEDGHWISTYVDLPVGRIEVPNPYPSTRAAPSLEQHYGHDYYAATVMGHIVDFARAVRGDGRSEFTDDDAKMSMMMTVAARESALRRGELVALPLSGALEGEERARKSLNAKYGADPLDVEAMLAVSYPRL